MMLQTSLLSYLKETGFKPPVYVQGLGAVSELLPHTRKSGIYVLHFADGAAYVGQSQEVAHRFKQHAASLTDIMGLSFKPAKEKDLDRLEREVIANLEALAIPLRNRALVSMPGAATASFDELFSADLQDRWLHDMEFIDAGGERPDDEEQRSKYEDRFRRWSPQNGQVVGSALRAYVPIAVPAFRRTEWVWWSASCLQGRGSGWRALSRISINWQEVICIFKDGEEIGAYLQVAYSPLEAAYGSDWSPISNAVPSATVSMDAIYEPGGDDQIRLVVERIGELGKLLRLRPVQRAIRRMNLGLMMKGRTPWPRSHCFQVADLIFSDAPTGARKLESRPRSSLKN